MIQAISKHQMIHRLGQYNQSLQLLFAGNGQERKKLQDVVGNCAYCGVSLPPKNKVVDDKGFLLRYPLATFDHLRPDTAEGSSRATNGVLSCGDCNSARGNVPLLEFLKGHEGMYTYKKNGTSAEPKKVIRRRKKSLLMTRKQSFSNYLRFFVENRIQVKTRATQGEVASQCNWFVEALDNILYPIWGQGQSSKDPAVLKKQYVSRVKTFLNILSDTAPSFWLGKRFEEIVTSDFKAVPEKRDALLTAIFKIRKGKSFQNGDHVVELPTGQNPFSKPLPPTGTDK